jgi:hypothetical protein
VLELMILFEELPELKKKTMMMNFEKDSQNVLNH